MNIACIGGGNMASAIVAGLLHSGHPAAHIHIVEPHAPQRQKLAQDYPGVALHASAGPDLAQTDLVLWAVKPQVLAEVIALTRPHLAATALHLSVAAGITTEHLQSWLASDRIVRAMPNTPALVGLGMTGLFACAGVSPEERQRIEQTLAATGQILWLQDEQQLDAVTAVSGSGPAYVFYFMESMMAAGVALGLTAEQAKQLTLATFTGAAHLAASSSEPPSILRERVTSQGGTTYAALQHMQATEVGPHIMAALEKAAARAAELGRELGAPPQP